MSFLSHGKNSGILQTLPNGTTVIFSENFKGVMTQDGNKINFTWKKTADGKYQVDNEKGEQVLWTMNSSKNSMTNPLGMKLSKQTQTSVQTSSDPFVGVWIGNISDDHGVEVKTSLVVKNDGTGVCYDIYDDGAITVYPLTWKKNSDSKYSLLYSDGKRTSVTLNDAKDTLTTASGYTQKKFSPESAITNSLIGAWYNKDSNEAGVFNADNTGFIRKEAGTAEFTWKADDSGKITIMFSSGASRTDGSSIAGQSFKWTYDSKTDSIATSYNEKFVRPSESIKDRITISK